ncbi:MAG: zf-HC2 domain-containing protein [Armatimonadetes bacterium]|nr:zf-HC2 domain-containing protein [Armatimonadota bacterium]
MSECPKDLIARFVDGETSLLEGEEVKAHLAGCPSCRALEKELSAFAMAMESLPEISLPDSFTSRVLSALPSVSPRVIRIRSLAFLWTTCLAVLSGLTWVINPYVIGDSVTGAILAFWSGVRGMVWLLLKAMPLIDSVVTALIKVARHTLPHPSEFLTLLCAMVGLFVWTWQIETRRGRTKGTVAAQMEGSR